MRKFVVIMFVLLVLTVTVGASEVPGITPLDFPVSPPAHWIWNLLAGEAFAAIAGAIFCWVLDRVRDSRIRRALLAIKTAVTICYQEYVRVVKAASANGKMTLEQKDKALEYAYAKAIEYARRDGVSLLKVFAKDTVLALIEKFVGESKATIVAGPLADLPA